MEFHILGPLEVRDGERMISLEAPKQRALLAVLLLHPNEVVSSERLIDELWGDRPPATAGKVAQTYVSQLRKALGPEAILTRPPGYLIRIEDEALDARRFRRLAAEARGLVTGGNPEQADARYREALALWRGPPLADVDFESFARNEVERLEEERLDALTARVDCELALGCHNELVTELEALVRQFPFRERLRAQLMVSLYRCGRQADALRVYHDARRTLVEELGLEPSRELQELERAILNHDASLEPPVSDELARDNGGRGGAARTPFSRFRMPARLALAAAALAVPALVLAVVFAFERGEPASTALPPHSVGYIDARSGRLTSSFSAGRNPHAITLADNSVWVANYEDQTVTRFVRSTGESFAIPVEGHPTGLATQGRYVWVWTLEGRLSRIDPRFNVSARVPLDRRIAELTAPIRGIAPAQVRRRLLDGKIASGDGYLWIAMPPTVIRIDPTKPHRAVVLIPADGVEGSIAFGHGEAWVAGYNDVFPIETRNNVAEPGVVVGLARSLAFGDGSLWVVSGGQSDAGVALALRRVDLTGRVVETTIPVTNPIAVAAAGRSIWVASGTGRTVSRIDPDRNTVVQTIPLHERPTALAADTNGVWVAVR